MKKNIDGGNLLASQKTLHTIGSESESSMDESRVSMKELTSEKKKPRLNRLKQRGTVQIFKLEKQVQVKNILVKVLENFLNILKTLQTEDAPMALILKCQTLEEENKVLANELEKLKAEINAKTQTIEDFKVLAQNSLKMQCDLQDSQIKISNLQKEYNEKCQEISLVEERVESKKNKIQELKQHVEELKEKKVNMSISQFMITKNDEIEKYAQEIEDLKKNNLELKEQLEESTKMNKDYKEELSSAIFSPDANRRKSSFFPSADMFSSTLKGENFKKLDIFQGDIKKVEKHAIFEPILPETTEIQTSKNINDHSSMRRASALPFKTEEGSEDDDFSMGKAFKRGSAILSQKDSELFIKMAKKQKPKKKHSVVKFGRKSSHFEHQNVGNTENIQESPAIKVSNMRSISEIRENKIREKETSQERIPTMEENLMIQQTQTNISNQEIKDINLSKNEDRQETQKQFSETDPIKIPETTKKYEKVSFTPLKRESTPLQKKKVSLAKPKQESHSTQNTVKDVPFQRSSWKLDFPPETSKAINRPQNIDSNKETSKSLNKTAELPISKPKTQLEIAKNTSSFHISTSTEIQSISKIASSPEKPLLNNQLKILFVPLTKKSPTNFQKQLNNLLANENSSIDQQRSPNSVSVHLNPLQKVNERFVKTTFFSPNQNTQINFSMDFPEMQQKPKKKHLSYVSIPNIFYINVTRQTDKSPDTNSLNSRNFSENKFPLLKNVTSKNRIDHYKSKINNIIGDQLNLLTEVNLSSKKPSFYDFEKTNSELFPNVSTKIKREIQFLTKRNDDDKNIEAKPQNTEKIREFFDDNQSRSFYEKNTALNNGVHRRNNSDHQLQLLNIDFSKIKIKIDPNAIFHGLQEKKLEEIYEKLEENEGNKELLEQIKGKAQGIKPNFNNFKKFVRDFEKEHKKCGRNCTHLKRFYEKLGLEKDKREVLLLHKRDLK